MVQRCGGFRRNKTVAEEGILGKSQWFTQLSHAFTTVLNTLLLLDVGMLLCVTALNAILALLPINVIFRALMRRL